MYIQLIGLGGLLKTPSIKIRRVLCLAIANSYDAEQDAFIINGRPCRITLEDVAHITGMPCHGKKHVPSNLDDNMELWKKLKDRSDTKITFNGALAKMKVDRTPNFVRPFVLYIIGKYVCRTKEEYVDNKYIGIVRNVETIKGTNLGQLTLDYLMDSVKNFVNGEAILEGNLALLQVTRSSTIITCPNIHYIMYENICKLLLLSCRHGTTRSSECTNWTLASRMNQG